MFDKPSRSCRAASLQVAKAASDERGATSIIFAFCCVALFGLVGGAIDFGLFFRAKSVYTEAVDRAALAAARVKQTGGTDEQALAMASSMMADVIDQNPVLGSAEFKIGAGGTTIEGIGSYKTEAVFLRVLGINELAFDVVNKAEFRSPTSVELSLMLDTTGSMSGAKMEALKLAVDDLIEIVIHDGAGSNSRIAIAPFSNAVALNSKQFKAATGRTKGSGGCVVERTGDEAYTDAAPGAAAFVTPLEDMSKAECKSAKEIFPLSNKKSDLKELVQSLNTGGATAGHLGTAWAWYMLSPAWAGVFESEEKPAPYSDMTEILPSGARKLRKIAVLMTDGEYNTAYSGVDSTTQARAICAELKKTGVEVYTVGFEVGSVQSVLDTLQGCASATGNFYNATNAEALKAAFRDIALKASTVRLSK